MSFEDLYAADVEAGIQRTLANPGPTAGASFSTAAMLKAGSTGVPRGALEIGGSLLDILSPAAQEVARRPRLKVLQDQPDDRARVEATAKFVSEGGEIMRTEASTFAPDPTTAHAAEQVLHGFTRIGTKVVAATAVAPNLPVAAAFLGAEGTNTAYNELRHKGIDKETALKAALVEGGGQAAAVLPMAGPTIKATIGLGVASGPGAFMAQEELSRRILKQAGYNDEASRHDPLDPLGLSIATLLPFAVGGAHIAGLARARPTLADVVLSNESGGKRYGTDGKLLTSPKGAQGEMQVMPKTATDPGFGVVAARDTSPDELARVGRDYLDAMVHRYGSADQAMAAYNAGPGAVDAALVKAAKDGSDWLSHLPKETQDYVAKGMKKLGQDTVAHAATDPAAVDAARVRNTEDARMRSMPDDVEAPAMVLRATDDIAAGRRPTIDDFVGPDTWDRPAALPHPAERADDLRGMGEMAFWAEQGGKMLRAPLEDGAGMQGAVVGRTQWIPAEAWFGEMRSDLGKGGLSNQADIKAAIEKAIADQPMRPAEQRTVDWIRGEVERMRQQLDPLLRPDEHIASDAFSRGLSSHDAADLALTARAAVKNERAVEDAARMHENDDVAFMAAIREILGDEQHTIQTADASASPGGRGAGARAPREPAREDTASNALPAADQVTIELPAAEKAPEPPPASKRVDEIVKDTPDLRVQLPGTDKTLTVEEALQSAKDAHAADMTESKLLQAALECALGFGG